MTQKEIFHAVKQNIDAWNPYSLLPESPNDEFDNESKAVSSKISANSSVNEIARIVSLVFSSNFEKEDFQLDDCIEVAKQIKRSIEKIKSPCTNK